MDDMKCFCEEHPFLTTVASGLVFATAGIVVYRLLRSDDNENYPSDTVILHQIGRGPFAPSMTPFAVKVETYLRMSKIPYENVHDRKKSAKGKFPWISYNGQSVADSAFCIDFINSRRGIDLNNWLTPEQKGIALAFQRLAEDDLYWIIAHQRWVDRFDMDFFSKAFPAGSLYFISAFVLKFLVRPNVRKMIYSQGMGRHSEDERLIIFKKDLTALSDVMGSWFNSVGWNVLTRISFVKFLQGMP